MINGNINEFIDKLVYGDEVTFVFEGKKFFVQGYPDDGIYTLYLDQWEPPADDYIFICRGSDKDYPVNEFLEAKIWDGKSFWEIEKEVEWVDA